LKLRWFSALLPLALCTAVHAQIAAYGLLSIPHVANNSAQTTTWNYGPTVGIYDDFLHLGPLSLGADLRAGFSHNTNQNYRDVLFGVRVAAKAPVLPIKPYIQGEVGVGSVGGGKQTGLFAPSYSNKATYGVLGGVDMTILPHIDFRALELGFTTQKGTAYQNPSNTNVFTLSTGIVIRL
jgi:hypothetical protein